MHRLHWECKDYLSQQEEADFVSLYEYNFFLSQFKTDLKCLRREHINHCGWDRANLSVFRTGQFLLIGL